MDSYFLSDVGRRARPPTPRHPVPPAAWLAQCVADIWEGFASKFLALWDEQARRGAQGPQGTAYPQPMVGAGAAQVRC